MSKDDERFRIIREQMRTHFPLIAQREQEERIERTRLEAVQRRDQEVWARLFREKQIVDENLKTVPVWSMWSEGISLLQLGSDIKCKGTQSEESKWPNININPNLHYFQKQTSWFRGGRGVYSATVAVSLGENGLSDEIGSVVYRWQQSSGVLQRYIAQRLTHFSWRYDPPTPRSNFRPQHFL